MEQVRDSVLDNLCEGIGDHRDTMNASKVEEQSMIAAALKRMQQKGTTVYKHARVAMAREPGAEKLRVRIVKEEGDAGEADLEPADAGQGESNEHDSTDPANAE